MQYSISKSSVVFAIAQLLGFNANRAQSYTPEGYLGCFVDSLDRIMPDRFYTYYVNNTGDFCKTQCKSEGFRYAGTQYEWACFCSDTIKKTSAATDCNTRCPGRREEFCGGTWRMSIYDTWSQADKKKYYDQLAETFCMHGSNGYKFVVKRNCNDSPPCNQICEGYREDAASFLKSVVTQVSCYNAVHIYKNNSVIFGNGHTYGYGINGCSWQLNHCGPNYCCCKGN